MSDTLTVLTVGDTPSSLFLGWRLQTASMCQVSSAWSNPQKFKRASIISDKFGSGHQFEPTQLFDLEDLSAVKGPTVIQKSHNFLGNPLSSDYLTSNSKSRFDPAAKSETTSSGGGTGAGGYDVIIASVTRHRQLNAIYNKLQNVIIPNHTIILLDASGGLTTIQNQLQQKLPNNPVLALITDASLCQSPTLRHPFQVVHSGQTTKTVIQPTPADDICSSVNFNRSDYESRLNQVCDVLISVHVDATIWPTAAEFIQLQWEKTISFVVFQPLSIIFDTPNAEDLCQSKTAKPIYKGMIHELIKIANGQGAQLSTTKLTPQYFVDNLAALAKSSSVDSSSTSTNSASTSPSSFEHCDSPLLYYNYFHGFSIPVDILLLQPLLQADKLRLKSPYLESVYAFMSQIVSISTNPTQSCLFQRRVAADNSVVASTATTTTTTKSNGVAGTASLQPPPLPPPVPPKNNGQFSSSSPMSCSSSSSPSPTTPPATMYDEQTQTGNDKSKLKALQAKEESILKREQALVAREQEFIQYRRDFNHRQFSHPPPPRANRHYHHPPPPPPPANYRPHHGHHGHHGHHTHPEPEVDMMTLTARRQRRSVSGAPTGRNSSTPSLRGYPSHGHLPKRLPSMSSSAGYLPPQPQPFSQQFDLDDVMEFTSSRYGTVPINSRRLSSTSSARPSASSSRANSITSQTNQHQQLPPPPPHSSATQAQLEQYQYPRFSKQPSSSPRLMNTTNSRIKSNIPAPYQFQHHQPTATAASVHR